MEEIRVLIMTPMAIEYQAVAKYLANPKRFVHEKAPHAAYTVGEFIGKHHKYQVIIREPGQLPIEMALATQEAIQHFHPQIALQIGVAGGIKDVTLGDVLVATKVYSYEGGKEDKDGFKARPAMGGGSKELLAYAQIMSKSDEWKTRTHDGAHRSRIFFGAIASGSKVVANSNSPTYQNIKKHFNDSLGVEMEAYGFISALNAVHGMVIRGISDLCEGKAEASDERWQPVAVDRAAAVGFEILAKIENLGYVDKSRIYEVGSEFKALKDVKIDSISIDNGKNIVIGSTIIHKGGDFRIGDG